jgi:hypothetical protein
MSNAIDGAPLSGLAGLVTYASAPPSRRVAAVTPVARGTETTVVLEPLRQERPPAYQDVVSAAAIRAARPQLHPDGGCCCRKKEGPLCSFLVGVAVFSLLIIVMLAMYYLYVALQLSAIKQC